MVDASDRQTIVAGTGSAVGELEQVATSHGQARIAVRVAQRHPCGTCRWDEFPLDAVLATMLSSSYDERLIPEPIKSLSKTQVAQTLDLLELYLDRECNVIETASTLHLHRATVYQPLARFEQTTGFDLADGQVRLLSHLWLKARWYCQPAEAD